MRLIEKLKAIRALIDTPAKWTKRALARDKDGKVVLSRDHTAVCYCLKGAWRAVCPFGWVTHNTLENALPAGFRTLTHFNDDPNTTHTAIMALIGRAIAAEQTKENMR